MNELVGAVREAILTRQWYPALALALALPDICGFLESPADGSMKRYVAWCDEYLVPLYTRPASSKRAEHVFLSGEDCYALRCAFLHQGSEDITSQRARQALDSFEFIEPPPMHNIVHRNQLGGRLQLQVDMFCLEVCDAADRWIGGVLDVQPQVKARTAGLLRVRSMEGGVF